MVVFCHIKPPISPSTGLSRVLVLLLLADYGQPASPPLFNSSAELRNFVFGCCCCFFAISNPLSLEYGPLACFGPTRTTASPPACPYSIVPQSCGILCCFLSYQIPYLSSTGPLACFLVLLTDYGQPASPPLFNSSAELRNFVFGCFLPYQTPYLAEYGPLACFGPTPTRGLRPARQPAPIQ